MTYDGEDGGDKIFKCKEDDQNDDYLVKGHVLGNRDLGGNVWSFSDRNKQRFVLPLWLDGLRMACTKVKLGISMRLSPSGLGAKSVPRVSSVSTPPFQTSIRVTSLGPNIRKQGQHGVTEGP